MREWRLSFFDVIEIYQIRVFSSHLSCNIVKILSKLIRYALTVEI